MTERIRANSPEANLNPWTRAQFVGQVVAIGGGVAVAQTLAAHTGGWRSGIVVPLLVGAVAGVAVGASQWSTLRRAVGDLRVRAWISASALGGALVGVLAAGTVSCGPFDVSSLPAVALVALASGLGAGATLGAAQAWALRRRPAVALRWLAANAVGWAFGVLLLVLGLLGTVLTSRPGVPGLDAAIMLASISAMAVAVAFATGLALRFGRR